MCLRRMSKALHYAAAEISLALGLMAASSSSTAKYVLTSMLHSK